MASISKLYLDQINVSSFALTFSYSGGLAGYLQQALISKCIVSGSVSSYSAITSAYSGGLVGYTGRSSLLNSMMFGSVSSRAVTSYSAGLVGYINNSSKVLRSMMSGSVSSDASLAYSGGLIGFMDGDSILETSMAFSTIYNRGDSTSYLGGLIGYDQKRGYTLRNLFFAILFAENALDLRVASLLELANLETNNGVLKYNIIISDSLLFRGGILNSNINVIGLGSNIISLSEVTISIESLSGSAVTNCDSPDGEGG